MGDRHIGKTLCWRFICGLLESRKFCIDRTVRQWADVQGIVIYLRCRPTPDDIGVLRGLRHCLSSIDGQCESLNKRDRQGADSRAFSFMFS